jgi:hypothetical protein
LRAELLVHFSSNAKQNHGHRILGYATRDTRKKLVNQADPSLEERRQRILSQMAAPVMRKKLDLDTDMSACAGASENDRESDEAPESGTKRFQIQASVSPGDIGDQDDHTWYVVDASLSLNAIPSNSSNMCPYSPICLEAMLPQQMVRQMPHCTHIFHQHCCEVWIWKSLNRRRHIRLSSPMVCPLCRADLESQQKDVVKKPQPVALTTSVTSLQQV